MNIFGVEIPADTVASISLALVLAILNQRGIWVSGREHKSMKEEKDKQIRDLREELQHLRSINERTLSVADKSMDTTEKVLK